MPFPYNSSFLPLTRLPARSDGVESVERVSAAGDVGIPPKFDARQLQHFLEDGGAGEAASKSQRR